MKSSKSQLEVLTLLPVLHGRLEFGAEVHRRLCSMNPDAIAVEFPGTIKEPILRAAARLPFLSVIHYQEKSGAFVYLLAEPQDPLFEAVRFGMEHALPIYCIDLDVEGYPRMREPMPDSYALVRVGYETYIERVLRGWPEAESSMTDARREAGMCFHLQRLAKRHERVACVFGLSHYAAVLRGLDRPQARPLGRVQARKASLGALDSQSSREVLSEMPFLARRYEEERQKGGLLSLGSPDRLRLHRELVDAASEAYFKNEKEEITAYEKRVLFQFARNYAWVQGRLVPDFYQLIVAARGAVNDNFAFEMWEIGADYAFQEESPSIPVIRVSGEDLFLNQKLVRFHRRIHELRRRLVAVPGRRQVRGLDAKKWKEEWTGQHICSYPPEDIAVEGFGDYVKKRAVYVLSEEQKRVAPFCASLLDGIDVRETIRNWVSDGTIYVCEQLPMKGKIGSVVIIFDEDADAEQEAFPWKLTWLGEHDQESDMAFYATRVGEHLVGPGISKCIHGGFMLTYPPMRVYDIWQDPFFEWCRTKSERLLMAALDYSLERNVVYVAAVPPGSRLRSMAERLGRKIIYLPIGMFSPQTLKRMRTFHVLDGHHVRKYARSYIKA